MAKTTLVIMAGGMGSRYGGLKQLEKIGPNHEKLIDYSIYDAKKAGFDRVVFLIKEENLQLFKQEIGDAVSKHIEVAYAFQSTTDLPEGCEVLPERTKPWGTGHAIWCCRNVVDGPFAVINADDYYGPKAFQIVHDHITADHDGIDYIMAGYVLKNTLTDNGSVSRGVCQVQNGKLCSIEENKKIVKGLDFAESYQPDGSVNKLPLDSVVSMNFWGFTPDVFEKLEQGMVKFMNTPTDDPLKREYLLPEEVENLLRAGYCSVTVIPTDDRWYGVTYPEDREPVTNAIRNLVRGGMYPDSLWD
ncbi:MAG: nucleotidyltransferase [Clostridia bacterium]|nr:nucleotidyltransferase [Clostridia bacterium]